MSSGLFPYAPQWRLYLPRLRVEYDDAVIAVAVGDVQLIGLGVDKHFGRSLEVFDIVAAFALAGVADLHQELPALRELEDHVVVEGSWATGGALAWRGAGGCRRRRPLPPIQTLPL